MQKFANNWKAELLTPLAFDGAELDVPADLSAALGLGPEDYADLTINPDGPAEIVRVVSGEDGVLTIAERGLEGTEPADWAAGSVVACCVTAGMLERLQAGGGAPITVALSDPAAPPSIPGEAYINADIGTYWLATAYEDGGKITPEWARVWSQDPPPRPEIAALAGRINDFYEPVLDASWQWINFIPLPWPASPMEMELYLQSTTFITVTATAEVSVHLDLHTEIVDATGFFAAGAQIHGFDLNSGAPAATFTLEPGVYPIRLEAHAVIPENRGAPAYIKAKIASGAASTRRGISAAQGPLWLLDQQDTI